MSVQLHKNAQQNHVQQMPFNTNLEFIHMLKMPLHEYASADTHVSSLNELYCRSISAHLSL